MRVAVASAMTIPFNIVGFDLDGTLLDTSRDLGAAVNHALSLVNREPVPLVEAKVSLMLLRYDSRTL